MNNPTSRASRRVRFEEVTPAHEYAAFFNVSIAPLVAHLSLPIFDGYDDLDDLQLAFLTLPSGETVTLGEYAGMPGTSLYIDVAMQNIPQIIFDSCQQLRVSRQEIEWIHLDWQVEVEKLYIENGEIDGIDKSSTVEAVSQNNDREPIDCFFHALRIYTRSRSLKHCAMLQHNLGLAYFDRIKGERWENLQKSITCFYQSLQFFTQDKFPQKWQINQEDLSQSQEALKIEMQHLIGDILDRHIEARYLVNVDLSGLNLHGVNLSSANLRGADLSGSNLHGANLRSANLRGADLSGSNLHGANLREASLFLANLSLANLSLADLNDANVDETQFGDNEGLSESMKQDLIARGAIFEDSPGNRSESQTLVPR
jgi:Pentapeptide repeats (8 copies)